MPIPCPSLTRLLLLWGGSRPAVRRATLSALRLASLGVGLLASTGLVWAQAPVSLADLSIEQLLNEPVISTERAPASLFQAAAAVSVVSADEINRLDLTTLPEALRYVPGMDVAQVSASQWAVASRGSNDLFANDTLVLYDGRSLYNDETGGVFWKAQTSPLIDIDRIEVVRGPGASLWGANAVNGVVNIVSKTAFDTTGLLVTAAEGTEDNPEVTARFGALLGSIGAYRLEVTYFDRNGLVTPTGANAEDGWRGYRADARVDLNPTPHDAVLLEAGYYDVITNDTQSVPLPTPPYASLIGGSYSNFGYDVMGRWSRSVADQSNWSLQGSVSRDDDSAGSLLEKSQILEINFQDSFAPTNWQAVVGGAEYRLQTMDLPVNPTLTWAQLHLWEQLYSAFIQDKITLVPEKFALIAGTKVEHHYETGFEIQPTVRLDWTPNTRETLWAGVSRAVRTPTVFESEGSFAEPLAPTATSPAIDLIIAGNPNLQAEKLTAYEAGWRSLFTADLSLDVEVFYNQYSNLIDYGGLVTTLVSTPSPYILAVDTETNVGAADSWGGEAALSWQAQPHWRVAADYSFLRMGAWLPSSEAASSPESQFHLRSYWDFTRQLSLNAAIGYVSPIIYNGTPIPGYTRLDVGVVWKPSAHWEMGLWGRNLLQARHLEFTSSLTSRISEVPRGFDFRFTWKH